ncbi:MAG: 4-hydroxy-tetrahydrodipicolinate synthase [Oscillospiraceae bacterium]|nr:4-hydroxy-tetrahydrodipicolinate synthase [Oscillospiraceae bacterium]
MDKPLFIGAGTALITPTTPAGVDYEALGRLIDWQIDEGIDALVIAGTTGEGKTLSIAEHKEVLRYSAERIAGRVPMIAGTGSNEMTVSLSMSKYACEIGADGLLIVTPYYIKATQNGLVKMYSELADAVTKPLILYNVPSRTGVNIEPATYARLADHPNIAGIKEANSDISKIVTTAQLTHGRLDIYSGNDDQVIPILSVGGKGVISVLSNLLPKETSRMCHLYFEGKTAEAAALQFKYLPLIHALFSEVNPIPVKAAMHALGWCENFLRMPLTPMEEDHKAAMLGIMRELGLLKE